MTKRKNAKQRLICALLVLVLAISSLIGTTFAWFTDSVTSSGNKIQSGTLKIDLLHKVEETWISVSDNSDHKIFNYEKWEPGYTRVEALKAENLGTLALKYKLSLEVEDGSALLGANGENLADVIDVYTFFGQTAVTDLDTIKAAWTSKGTLTEVMKNPASFIGGELLPKGTTPSGTEAATTAVGEQVMMVALTMREGAGNEYQNLSVGNIYVNLIATQFSYEGDSFGKDYDNNSQWPNNVIVGANSATATVTPTTEGKVDANGVNLESADQKISASVPEGVQLESGATALTLTVGSVNKSEANITLDETEASVSIDVHIAGVAASNTVPIKVYIKELLPTGLNIGNYRLYHVENGATNLMTYLTAGANADHNTFDYDPATGDVYLYLKSFSEVALVADTENAWEGNFDYSWYDADATDLKIANADQLAAFGAIVGGMNGQTQDSFKNKTVKLLADVNLGDKESENNPNLIFYPIGYNSDDGKYEKTGVAVTTGFYSFMGTFDGNGNTISNFYQNTWEMKGDNNYYDATLQYYRDGMGLFGKVYGGTVKNLTVKNFSSDGEYTTTGTIAAYAEGATFENIAIFNCNPRVYNIGNGGIVGCVGWYAKEAGLKTTFTNITVDNSNKISALWGSWDVACGGLVGQYYPTSGQSSADYPANAGIDFVNCHVSAQIDVYNDVCANYQYYAYRYAGMMIGSIRENETIDGHVYPKMDGITAEGCTVHFGDWNDYYYCELVANSLASYTHDHQMSRLTEIKAIDGTTITYLDGTTGTVPASGRANYVIVDYTKGHGTENATCYHFVDGKAHNHDDYNGDGVEDYETVNGESIRVENNRHIYLEFNNLFTGYGWGVTSKGIGDLAGVTILDKIEGSPIEKFETKFTGDFLYRVGNSGTVTLGTLFGAKKWNTEHGNSLKDPSDEEYVYISDSGVWVKVEKLDENMNVSGTFTANTTDWTKGTIQFSGTGVVKVTIQDYFFCTPTELILEVVDAKNATTATSATANNVVLLQDCGFSSLKVSGGYTLYGNGFTMTCSSDSVSLSFGQFVELDNGTLDNVQIVCPNYDYAALYNSQLKDTSANRSETTDGTTRYYNAKSAVLATGNSQILNSRISGGRAALYASNGNIVVDNSRLEGGAVATVIISAANSFVFRDTTLIQQPTESTYKADGAENGTMLMGMSVLYLCDTDGNATPTTLEGSFIQYAWADSSCAEYMPSGTDSIVTTVLNKSNCTHTVNEKKCANLGFAYMPNEGTTVNEPSNITDNRTDKSTIPYDYESVSAKVTQNGISITVNTYVYSYQNTNGTNSSFATVDEYVSNKYSDIIAVSYSDATEGLTTGKSYGTNGWIYELNVDLDTVSGYALDFSKLTMTVNGVTVTNFLVNGAAKPTSPVPIVAGGTTYTLTATVNETQYTVTYVVIGVETSKDAPQLIDKIGGSTITEDNVSWGEGKCVTRKDDRGSTNYTGAAPVLEGIIIRYWSVAHGKYIDLQLSKITPDDSTALNGTNNYWEYKDPSGDYTLKITNTAYVHEGNKVYAMPVSNGEVMYFVASASNGLVSTGSGARSIAIKYEFTDNNGGELTFSHTWTVEYNSNNPLSYETLTGIKDGCVTPDTLVTLADGTQVRVDSLTGNEELLVWNMETGMLDKAPIMFVDSDAEAEYEIIHLYFSDGTDVKVIYEHGFWDYDLNKYVYLDKNAADYIGHTFAKQNGDALEEVTLVDVVIETEVTTAWSPVTEGHLCYFVNGMLSMPGGIDGLFNIFEVDPETMTYDQEQLEKDIEAYGLYTYEELNSICPLSEEMFNAAGGAYLKISIGKGNLTIEELCNMINRYSKFFN